MSDFDDIDAVQAPERDNRVELRSDAIEKRAEVDRVIRALRREGPHLKVFQFTGQAVVMTKDTSTILRRVKGKDEITRSVPRQANGGLLLGPIEGTTTWMKWFRTGEGEDRPVAVPEWVTKLIMDIHGEGLRPLAVVADFPVIGDNGKLLTGRRGYDQKSRLFVDCEPVGQLEEINFKTPQDAFDFLVNDWLGEFNFATRDDAARALSIPLTILNRRTRISGGAPIPFVTAPTPNTGKTMLVQALTEVVTAQPLAATSWDHDNDQERRKMFMSIGLENPAAVLFDNINNGWEVRDSTLERWCTSDSISDRLLGKNEQATAPTTTLPIFTGNNISTGSDDLASRSYEIRMERPKNVKAYKRADILTWTMKNRSKIFAALMKIATHKSLGKYVPTSRFPSWAEYVGGPIQFAAQSTEVFSGWGGTGYENVNEELEKLLIAMAKKNDGKNAHQYLPKDMSELFSFQLTHLDPAATKQWMKDHSGAILNDAKVPPVSIPKILKKYNGHMAGNFRFRMEKGVNPIREGRKSWVFKAVDE